MKAFEYKFEFKPGIQTMLMKKLHFDKYKQEKKILQLLFSGYTCNQIGETIGCSERTIVRRRKVLYNKIINFLQENNIELKEVLPNCIFDTYVTYILIFPNDKVYIGQTVNTKTRWTGNGIGYRNNKEMYEDIQKYGWNNVKKLVIDTGLTYEESLEREKELIIHYRSNIPTYGYNKIF